MAPAELPMLQVHDRLGDFEIVRLLGKGGMGEVYEAQQFNPERRVALKVLAPWLANDDDALQRFWREAKVPANLDHPGIVRIISTGQTPEGVAYFAMHLVRGLSLAEMIRRANLAANAGMPTQSLQAANTPSAAPPTDDNEIAVAPTPVGDSVPPCLFDYRHDRFVTVARIGVQAARALAYAHAQGHLHRDIKPSNLMVDVHNHVYLVDFGWTRALQPAGDGTHSGALVGTPWYMSPEQAEGKTLDARSDIYSLGVALFELATQGLGPFTANRDNRDSVLTQVRAGQTLPLRMLAPGIPPALEQIILRAMQHKPKRRYASAAELADDLQALCGQSGGLLPQPTPRSLRQRPKRRWPLAIAGAAGVAILIAVAALAIAWRERPTGGNDEKKQDPVAEKLPGKPLLDGSQAFPEILRDKANALNVPVALMKVNSEPRWPAVLFGHGKYRLFPKFLELPCPPTESINILGLADPDRRNFNFASELMQAKGQQLGELNEMGIVFGWRRNLDDAEIPPRVFVVQLDETPTAGNGKGCVTTGTARLIPERGGRMETVDWFKPLPQRLGTMPLLQSQIWHALKVEVRAERVSLSVDQLPPVEFDLERVRMLDRQALDSVRTDGAIGIWARKGRAFFRNAAITALE
jgi:serine/threonine protein kinase